VRRFHILSLQLGSSIAAPLWASPGPLKRLFHDR